MPHDTGDSIKNKTNADKEELSRINRLTVVKTLSEKLKQLQICKQHYTHTLDRATQLEQNAWNIRNSMERDNIDNWEELYEDDYNTLMEFFTIEIKRCVTEMFALFSMIRELLRDKFYAPDAQKKTHKGKKLHLDFQEIETQCNEIFKLTFGKYPNYRKFAINLRNQLFHNILPELRLKFGFQYNTDIYPRNHKLIFASVMLEVDITNPEYDEFNELTDDIASACCFTNETYAIKYKDYSAFFDYLFIGVLCNTYPHVASEYSAVEQVVKFALLVKYPDIIKKNEPDILEHQFFRDTEVVLLCLEDDEIISLIQAFYNRIQQSFYYIPSFNMQGFCSDFTFDFGEALKKIYTLHNCYYSGIYEMIKSTFSDEVEKSIEDYEIKEFNVDVSRFQNLPDIEKKFSVN